jgi:hypothetical protein
MLRLRQIKVEIMKTQTLHISYALNDQTSRELSTLLLRIPGVGTAECPPGAGQISVDFDEDRTSALEIEATIARSGYRLVPTAAKSDSGSCCGSCGGQGH